MTPRRFPKRQTSFIVTVVRDSDGHRYFHVQCRKCKKPVGSVQEMGTHAKGHFSEADLKQWLKVNNNVGEGER